MYVFLDGVVSGYYFIIFFCTNIIGQLQEQNSVTLFLKAPCARNEKAYIEEKELSKNTVLTTLQYFNQQEKYLFNSIT